MARAHRHRPAWVFLLRSKIQNPYIPPGAPAVSGTVNLPAISLIRALSNVLRHRHCPWATRVVVYNQKLGSHPSSARMVQTPLIFPFVIFYPATAFVISAQNKIYSISNFLSASKIISKRYSRGITAFVKLRVAVFSVQKYFRHSLPKAIYARFTSPTINRLFSSRDNALKSAS